MEKPESNAHNDCDDIDITSPPDPAEIPNLALKDSKLVNSLLSEIESKRTSYNELLKTYQDLQSRGENTRMILLELRINWKLLDPKLIELKKLPIKLSDFNDDYDPDDSYDFGNFE